MEAFKPRRRPLRTKGLFAVLNFKDTIILPCPAPGRFCNKPKSINNLVMLTRVILGETDDIRPEPSVTELSLSKGTRAYTTPGARLMRGLREKANRC